MRTLNKLSKFKALRFMMDDKAERHMNRMFKIAKKISKNGAGGITVANVAMLKNEFDIHRKNQTQHATTATRNRPKHSVRTKDV